MEETSCQVKGFLYARAGTEETRNESEESPRKVTNCVSMSFILGQVLAASRDSARHMKENCCRE